MIYRIEYEITPFREILYEFYEANSEAEARGEFDWDNAYNCCHRKKFISISAVNGESR